MNKKLGLLGSCQLHIAAPYFFTDEVLNNNNISLIFCIPLYNYDKEYSGYIGEFDYNILNNLDILIIENNNYSNNASSKNIIDYCLSKNIKIYKTCLLKFPIYPINWSGKGENKEIIDCWFNPFTTKMVKDLDIKFKCIVDDKFYITRYKKNKDYIIKNI